LKQSTCEFYLILGTLFFAFFYFALRSIAFNNFIWIIIFPYLSSIYILSSNKKLSFSNFNGLDKMIYIYLFYGLFITCLGVFTTGFSTTPVEVFFHYYFPCIIYFVSRIYTARSISNFFKVLQTLWFIVLFLIADVLIEWILYNNGLSAFIPWVSFEAQNIIKFSSAWYELGFDRIGSILTSSKTTEMVFASLLAFIFPFIMINNSKDKKYYKIYFMKWTQNNFINILILFSVFFCWIVILKLSNKTAFLSLILVLIFFSIKKISIKSALLVSITFVSFAFLFYELFAELIKINFLDSNYYALGRLGYYKSETVFNHIFNFSLIYDGYINNSFFDYIFGKYIITGIASSYPFAFPTELRLFSTPLYFGFIWTIVVIGIISFIITYCFKLINYKKHSYLSYLGLSFISFYLIYFFDIHYPVFIRHGPIELFFIMTGALSSIFDNQLISNLKYKRFNKLYDK